jgi:uncharacterized protein (TIGR03437 family)
MMNLRLKKTFQGLGAAARRWLLVLPLLTIVAGLAAGQTSAPLFDDRKVHDIWLNIDPVAWQTLRDNYLLDTYYPAQFAWEGHVANKIGIRSRGSGSRSPEKPNLLLAFNRYDTNQQILGLTSVILKANNQDASLIREMVAMQLFRRMGLPAPREAPARLYINGEFFGAYTLVEVVDEAFLRRNFGEDAGYLYDWEENRTDGYHFEYLGEDPASYSPLMWTPKNHKTDPDPATIEAMVRAINFSSDAGFEREVSKYIDLKQFMTYIATENFIGEWDGMLGMVFGMNNFYTYRFAGTTLFQFLAWDKDNTFDWERHPIFEGVGQNVLARRAMQVPALRDAYLQALVKAAGLAGGAGGWMEREIERYYALVGDMARMDPHKQCVQDGVMYTCGAAEFELAVDHVRRFARARSGFVLSEVAGYAASFEGPRLAGAFNVADPQISIAPGSLVYITGEHLAAGTAEAFESPMRYNLADVIVTFNGARAPLLSVSPERLVAQVPWDLTAGPVEVTVFANGAASNTMTVPLVDFAPGILLVAHENSGEAVSPDRPVLPRETLIVYATGLGPVNHSAAAKPTLETPSVTFGDMPATVTSSVLAPEAPWLYKVRIELPSGVPAGPAVPVTLTVGGQTASLAVPMAREAGHGQTTAR